MKTILTTAVFAACAASASWGQALPVYLDDTKPIEQRVEDALGRMTLDEKIAVIHAQSKFSSPGVPRLGIPEFWTDDGPHGVRPDVLWDEWVQAGQTNDSCVAFPALTCLAATWNPSMASAYGKALGEEALYRGKDMILGPGVNIYRTPLGGRNFEYMGEDPCLASRMVVPYIRGLQSNGVAACVKHYALNNDEVYRHQVNVIVGDRALYEIYLPAFKAAVKEGRTWGIMGSYNLYDNQHNCHNRRLLVDILKGEWGYDGVVVSDWGGTHDTRQAIENGLDMEFGTWTDGLVFGLSNAYDNYFMARPYKELIQKGEYSTKELDDKVRRVLRLFFRTSMNRSRGFGSMNSEEHYAVARKVAGEGIVLLKNKGGILPLDTTKALSVLVVGENAIKMMTVGGGSSSLKAQRETLPLDGMRSMLGGKIKVEYARGYVGDTTGNCDGVVAKQSLYDLRTPDELLAEAVEKARKADCVVMFGGLNKGNHQDSEGNDRLDYALPYGQDRLIEALAKANANFAQVALKDEAKQNKEISLKNLSTQAGLVVLVQAGCSFCSMMAPVMERLTQETGLSVLPISIKGDVSAEWPTARPDNGIVKRLVTLSGSVPTVTPAIFLVEKSGETAHLIASGALSLEDLKERLTQVSGLKQPLNSTIQSLPRL